MSNPTLLQEPLLPEYVPSQEVEHKERRRKEPSNGSRLNLSQIETLSTLHTQYKKSKSEREFFQDIGEYKEREDILENAKSSIYGTQMHSLQYFTLLFHRAAYYNRVPNIDDFRYTFLQKKIEYSSSLLKVLNLSDCTFNDNILDSSQKYWNEWRMNGQDFTPSKHKNYTVSPSEIKEIWESGVIPLEDISLFKKSFHKAAPENLNPEKTYILNETPLILNIYFHDSNLLIPTVIDEICIPRDFPNTPIKIVDYKTGSQFKQPEFKEKIQIFLMLNSVLLNLKDRVKDIKFAPDLWEIAHEKHDLTLPHFQGKNANKKFIESMFSTQLASVLESYNNYVEFSYVNPVTQEKIDINLDTLGIRSKRDIEQVILYLNNISTFYLEYKDKLKHKIDSSKTPYTLPTFPIKNFTKDNGFSKGVQLPFNI
ncbi:MAG: hypothetical protein RBT33_01245 [Candidatus Dojkabacteria bacterium]|jgi:hypothetical protein|nr:hypothetical protein [Candidatus Dojkabacteria bacterium]